MLIASVFFMGVNAQEVVVPADSVTIVTEEAPAEDEEEGNYYPDTLTMSYRSVVYDSVQAIMSDKGFYYKRYLDSLLRASKADKPKPKKSSGSSGFDFFNSVFGIIFWIMAIGLFVFLIYKLFLSNSSILSRNRKNISSDISVEKEEDSTDPDALLRNAIRSGNYRLAVRYLYLHLLTRLSDKKYIEINRNKTNYEYVTEVRKHSFANEFASLTLKYEYVWYGEYPVDQKLFEQLQGNFTDFQKNNLR
jgi:hypothetical protein